MSEDPRDKIEFMAMITEARNEWLEAQNYFENASDPDLVDYAIYKLEAAKLRYMYLLKQARIAGINNELVIQDETGETFN
ncbi:MAG: YaaL family protein [Clostridiales bacterium]|nr:YaaL family protein [Clostridiales bacterium]